MRIIIYFAVTRYDDRIYMTEQEKEKSQNRFVDMVDDIGDLKNELDWSELDEAHRPKEVGCYQAVIEYRQTIIHLLLFRVLQYVLFRIKRTILDE